jgi:hypothetical protein
MLADGLGGSAGGERSVGDVERGFAGFVQQSGAGGAGVDETLNLNDGPDMGLPIAPGEFSPGSKIETVRLSKRPRPW